MPFSLDNSLLFSVVVLLLPLLAPLGQYLLKKLEAGLPANERKIVEDVVQQAVFCIEQTAPGLDGADRRAQALKLIEANLKLHGIDASKWTLWINTMLEAAVHFMNASKPSASVDAISEPDPSAPEASVKAPIGFTL